MDTKNVGSSRDLENCRLRGMDADESWLENGPKLLSKFCMPSPRDHLTPYSHRRSFKLLKFHLRASSLLTVMDPQ